MPIGDLFGMLCARSCRSRRRNRSRRKHTRRSNMMTDTKSALIAVKKCHRFFYTTQWTSDPSSRNQDQTIHRAETKTRGICSHKADLVKRRPKKPVPAPHRGEPEGCYEGFRTNHGQAALSEVVESLETMNTDYFGERGMYNPRPVEQADQSPLGVGAEPNGQLR